MSRSFVVRPGDAESIADVLVRLGEPESAIADGRVFLGRRRAISPSEAVKVGDEVVVQPAQLAVHDAHILSEWEGTYAVSKPSGLSTEPDRRGGESLVRRVAELVGAPSSVLHAATRLDTQVSGIVLVARGTDAQRRIAALKEKGALRRRYIALASRTIEPAQGIWDAPIGVGSRRRRVAFGRGAESATTRYLFTARAPHLPHSPPTAQGPVGPSARDPVVHAALAVLEPVTGRTHQLRVHAAAAGAPLLGDVTHGGPRRIVQSDGQVVTIDRVALHAARISVVVAGHTEWRVEGPVSAELVGLWARLGGDAAAFDAALAVPDLDSP